MEAVVFQPQTYAQVSLLQDLAKAMRIPVTLFSTMKSRQKAALLAEMQAAGAQARQIESGEIEGISFDQLLNELDCNKN